MSNSTNEQLTDAQLYEFLKLSLYTGGAAPKYAHIPIKAVMHMLADYAVAVNYSVTAEDLKQYFGTKERDIKPIIKIFGSLPEFAKDAEIGWKKYMPIVKHPMNPDIVQPIFLTFLFLTGIIMGLRLFSRSMINGHIMAYDWLALVGYLMSIVYGVLAVEHSMANGYWQAFYDKSFNDVAESSKYFFILQVFYSWVVLVIKLSLLAFYYGMTAWSVTRWCIYVVAFVVVGNTLTSFFVYLLQCENIDYWNHIFQQNCHINVSAAVITFGAIFVATDIAIWLLPLPLVLQLKLQLRERILVMLTFCLGAAACIASGFRLQAVARYTNYSSRTTSTLMIHTWSMIEINLLLICSSAPAVRALILRYAPKVLGSMKSRGTVIYDKERVDSVID
ncbi:hypothetical protein H072_6476 [Dactylellina haptotyla CBS 200.50]|uniref:Rhodopsin domain-containing protein n=1 Tax=Dactylellina haptotyla (strain CBS 200.50) TaxID=1284197 RepID=S8AEZ8_DACHA|nr:hypothetical protein H072_6476 [Dactylellina haptotyla CBS 200.50]